MTVVLEEEKQMADKKSNTNKILPHDYGCEVLLENTTVDKAKDFSFPRDAYIVWYVSEKEERIDLVRGTIVRIFDMYYDKYGQGSVQKIIFGCGKINPKLWGYKQPEKKKRK